jgi:hypothetical protein
VKQFEPGRLSMCVLTEEMHIGIAVCFSMPDFTQLFHSFRNFV